VSGEAPSGPRGLFVLAVRSVLARAPNWPGALGHVFREATPPACTLNLHINTCMLRFECVEAVGGQGGTVGHGDRAGLGCVGRSAQLVGMGADAGGGPGDPAAGGVNVLRLPSPVHPPGALSPPTVPLPAGGREREGRASEWGKGGGVRGSGRAGAGTQGRAQERAWVEGGSSAAAGAGFGRGHGDGASLAHAASASSTMVVLLPLHFRPELEMHFLPTPFDAAIFA
jgi:hypothetical protein